MLGALPSLASLVVVLIRPHQTVVGYLGYCRALHHRDGRRLHVTRAHTVRADAVERYGQDPGPGLDDEYERTVARLFGLRQRPTFHIWPTRAGDHLLLTARGHYSHSDEELIAAARNGSLGAIAVQDRIATPNHDVAYLAVRVDRAG